MHSWVIFEMEDITKKNRGKYSKASEGYPLWSYDELIQRSPGGILQETHRRITKGAPGKFW